MRTQVNPGRLLEVTGSFDLHALTGMTPVVVDRESGKVVELGKLLRSFLEDPEETVTGPIRIRIEAGAAVEDALVDLYVFIADDPGGLWLQGDLAIDLGPEAPDSPVWSIRVLKNGEILGLSEPLKVLRPIR